MQKYWNTVQDEHGNPRYGASVAVQQSGSNVTIYSDNGVTPATNPLTTDSTRGYFEFYAADGTYDLVVSGVGFAQYTVTGGAILFDPADHTAGDPQIMTDPPLVGQSLNILVNDFTEHAPSGSTLNQFGSVFQIKGGSGNQTISRVALQAAAQTGGSGTNDVEAANFVVQQNAADAATSMVALQLNVNNNKADDVLNPATAVSHVGLSLVSGGTHIIGPAAVFIGASNAACAWRRGVYVQIASITSDGFAFDYAGPGTGGVFQVNANGSLGVGTTAIANAAVAIGQVGTILTGGAQYSVFESSVASSAATSLFASFSAQPQTAAAAFTCTAVDNYRANNAVKGAASAITTLTGFNCLDLTSGTTNIGFSSAVTSGSNKYSFKGSTADYYFAGLVDISASTAGQVKFPSSQNASSNANTLDDYAEGAGSLAWTPVLTFSTPGNLAVTYSIRQGTYVKIGRLVYVQFNIVTSAFTYTTSAGTLNVTGLPFTSLNVTSSGGCGPVAAGGWTAAGYTNTIATVSGNSTTMAFSMTGSGVAQITAGIAEFVSGSTVTLRGCLMYLSDA